MRDKETIPTGGSFEHNFARVRTAFEKGGKNAKYLITGRNEPQDWIIQDYLLLNGVSPTNIGVDYESGNTEQNLVNCFPKDQEGLFEWNSYPLHNRKTKKLFRNLQKKDLVSKTVVLKFNKAEPKITSVRSFISRGKDLVYGTGALIEFYGMKIPFKESLKEKLS